MNTFLLFSAQFLQELETLYLQKDYEKVVEKATLFLQQKPFAADADKIAYWRIISLNNLGRYKEACDCIEEFLSDYPTSPFRSWCYIEWGRAYEGLGYKREALRKYKTVVIRYPEHPYIPAIYLRLASILVELDRIEEALTLYERTTKEFPETFYAKTAAQNLDRLKKSWPERYKEWKQNYSLYMVSWRFFYFQVGSFRNPANARKLVSKLKKNGVKKVFIEKILVHGTQFHRVLVGPFFEQRDMEPVSKVLERMGLDYIVLKE